jgi:hypothetical protein
LADKGQAASAINIAALCALFACGAAVAADEEATPDMEFLEYLGSWEESDEDWVLLAAEAVARVAAEMKGTDAASKKADSVETDDEN